MMSLTEELAKGNLSVPIKAEKSKFFGRFLWGMDMLRDNLESSREKELELQKEKKTLILSLAHDLKTPLSAIRLYNKALSENLYDTPEKRAQVYAGIDKNVTEMEGYVTKIMAASREEFLNLTVEMGEVYLSSVMEYINAYYTDKLSNLHNAFEVESYLDCLPEAALRHKSVECRNNFPHTGHIQAMHPLRSASQIHPLYGRNILCRPLHRDGVFWLLRRQIMHNHHISP